MKVPRAPTKLVSFVDTPCKVYNFIFYQPSQPLERKLVYQFSQPLWIGSNHLINYLTSFDEEESRHARDFELLRSSLVLTVKKGRFVVRKESERPRHRQAARNLLCPRLPSRIEPSTRTHPTAPCRSGQSVCKDRTCSLACQWLSHTRHTFTRFPPSHHVAVKSIMVSLF